MEYRNYDLLKYLGMLQSHLDIALKNQEATQHEIEEKLLQKTKANIDSEHPDKGGLILKDVFIWRAPLKISKFLKQIFLFSLEPKTKLFFEVCSSL